MNQFSGSGYFVSQGNGFEDFDFAGFAEYPADDFVFDGRAQINDQGTVGLAFDFELFDFLVFLEVESVIFRTEYDPLFVIGSFQFHKILLRKHTSGWKINFPKNLLIRNRFPQ